MTAPAPHLTDDTLFALLDGGLSPEARGKTSDHLAGCPDCRSRATAFESLYAGLASFPDIRAPRDLSPAVMAAVRTRAARQPDLPVRIVLVLQFVAAAALSTVLAVYLLYAFARGGPLHWSWPLPAVADPFTAWTDRLYTGVDALIELFGRFVIEPGAVAAGLTALLPLILTSSLLWLIGNGILIRNLNRNGASGG